VISDRGMVALRGAAALVSVVPQLRLRIRNGEEVLADVRRPPFPDEDVPPQIPPCVFHQSVARAHARRREGERMRFLSLPEGVDPAVDLGLPRPDRSLPGGIVRATLAGDWVHLVPVARSPQDCAAAVQGRRLGDLGFHHDPDVEVTVLHLASPTGDERRSAEAVDCIERAAAACAVADLEELLASAAAG